MKQGACFLFILLFMVSCEVSESQLDTRVHAFYYAWYGNIEIDGEIAHWNHQILPHGPDPRWLNAGSYPGVDDIGANFYPELGTYSSNDPEIIDKHMAMMKDAGIGVVSISWWGKNTAGGKSMSYYLDIAHKYGLKICFHIEPVFKTIEEFKELLTYVDEAFSDHPAFYKYQGKPLYYVYDSYKVAPDEWNKILNPESPETIRNTQLDATFLGIWVLKSSKNFFLNSGFDGFYTYYASDNYVWASKPINWPEMAEFAKKNNLIFCPSVGPGYMDTRIRPWNSNTTIERDSGNYYKNMFQSAIQVNPDFISITSFNEWHEGTQIEPAIPKKLSGYVYEDYGQGTDPDYYLKLTKELIKQYGK